MVWSYFCLHKKQGYHDVHTFWPLFSSQSSPTLSHHPVLCQYCSLLSDRYTSKTSSPHVAVLTRQTRHSLLDSSLPSILQCHFSLSFINLSSDNSLCIHCCTNPGNRNGLWLTSHHCGGFVFVHVDQKLPGLEKVI